MAYNPYFRVHHYHHMISIGWPSVLGNPLLRPIKQLFLKYILGLLWLMWTWMLLDTALSYWGFWVLFLNKQVGPHESNIVCLWTYLKFESLTAHLYSVFLFYNLNWFFAVLYTLGISNISHGRKWLLINFIEGQTHKSWEA